MERLVFFHKTPALWNKKKQLKNNPESIRIERMKKEIPPFSVNDEMNEFFSTDVYFHMCKEICTKLGIKEFHIIHGYREDEPRNWSVKGSQGWCQVDENTTYWSLTEPENLLPFMEASVIVSRGNYPVFHDWLSNHSKSPPNQFWLHYPATSIRFPHLEKYKKNIAGMVKSGEQDDLIESIITGSELEHNLNYSSSHTQEKYGELLQHFQTHRTISMDGPYTVVLADDRYSVDNLSQIFPSSIIQTFTKPAVFPEHYHSEPRDYDLIYCGTTLQTTKNHQCFIQLLKHLDTLLDEEMKIIIAGNKQGNPLFDTLFSYPFSHVNVFNMGEVPRSELQTFFSKTKTMILTSGRDANPRIIQESLVHGARVIAIDTLSDGQEFIENNPLLGAVLPSDSGRWKYERNGNLSFHPSVSLASLILDEITKSNFPDLVATIARGKLSVEQSVRPLMSTITSFR